MLFKYPVPMLCSIVYGFAAWFGILAKIDGAMNLLIFMIAVDGAMALTALFFVKPDTAVAIQQVIPDQVIVFTRVVSLFVIALLAWNAFWFLATVAMFSFCATTFMRDKEMKRKELLSSRGEVESRIAEKMKERSRW